MPRATDTVAPPPLDDEITDERTHWFTVRLLVELNVRRGTDIQAWADKATDLIHDTAATVVDGRKVRVVRSGRSYLHSGPAPV